VDVRYVFTYKLRPDNSIERRKVRIVMVKGYTYRIGRGCFEVWAPTGSLVAYRAILTYAAHDYDVSLMDIKCVS
jgi:hypothetical protein